MKGLALATVGLWVILQTTYGPLASKLGLIAGVTDAGSSTPTAPGGNAYPPGDTVNPNGSITDADPRRRHHLAHPGPSRNAVAEMSRWGNIILGVLGLAVLQGVLSGGSASNVGGFIVSAGKAVSWFVDPSVPAFSTGDSTSSEPGAAVAVYEAPTTTTMSSTPEPAGGAYYPSPQTVAQGGAV